MQSGLIDDIWMTRSVPAIMIGIPAHLLIDGDDTLWEKRDDKKIPGVSGKAV